MENLRKELKKISYINRFNEIRKGIDESYPNIRYFRDQTDVSATESWPDKTNFSTVADLRLIPGMVRDLEGALREGRML